MPFTGTDTMIFANSNGHIVTMIGQGKVNLYDTKTVRGAAPVECSQPTMSYEYQMIRMRSGDTLLNEIDFFMSRIPSPNYYSTTGSWVVNGTETYTNYFSTLLNDSAYLDTVFVNGKMINCIIIPADTGDASNKLYYNHNFGVLRIVLPQNQVWYKQ